MSRNCARLSLSILGLVLLAACTQRDAATPKTESPSEPSGELKWARAALERNPQLKVLSVDAAKNAIQVRVKASGETLTLAPGELAAIPIGDLIALANATREAQPTTSQQSPAVEAPVREAAPPAEPAKPEYKVEREDGRVRVTGPGVSIESNRSTAQNAPAVEEHSDEPIICDGKRMLHLDNRRIRVDGDAITARGGCELHITNSRINATGTGVTVLDAVVHISNSEVTGADGSLTASSAARVYLRGNTFTGLARRDPQATIQDQGGNTWR